MLSPFIVNDNNLFLDRFPINQVNRSLQAWDAADEYLINYLNEHNISSAGCRILIFNDSFGALTLNFTGQHCYSVSDSVVSQQGLKHNAEQNHLTLDNLSLLTTLDDLPDNIDMVLYKIPKSNSLLCEQLFQLRKAINGKTLFIAADKAKNIQKNTLAIFEKYLGTTTTSLAVKKARLVFCQVDNDTSQLSTDKFSQIKCWQLNAPELSIQNYANVFARERLDIGARLFIEHLPELKAVAKQVIDLGCGNGVVGLAMLAKSPDCRLHFVDESFMAVQSAKENVAHNFPEQLTQCQFSANDCLTDFAASSADVILCNPPFHQQNATTDHIAWQMFKDSYRVLKKGGELRIVGNRQLGYHIKLKRIFGNATLVASNKKFVIISAIKR